MTPERVGAATVPVDVPLGPDVATHAAVERPADVAVEGPHVPADTAVERQAHVSHVPADLAADGSHSSDSAGAASLPTDWGAGRRRRDVGPRLGVRGWARWAWRQLTSMRTALLLLLLLAIAAIPGSVLPQRSTDPLAVRAWLEEHPGLGPLVDRVGGFEVFGSPWFSAVYLLLFISLMGCVLPRTLTHWKAMRMPVPPAPRHLARVSGALAWSAPETSLHRAAAELRARRWRVSRDADSLAAEKGAIRELGNLAFHISLLAILVGVAMGSLWGWRGNVIIREGQGMSNTLTQYDTFEAGRLVDTYTLPPFALSLIDFEVTFEREGSQRGAPRSFVAIVDERPEPSGTSVRRTLSVNSPLRVSGAKVFLLGHGYAPHVRLRDGEGKVVFDDTVVFLPQDGSFTSTGVIKAPDADPQIGVTAIFAPTAAVDEQRGPHSTFPAPDDPALFASLWRGDLGMDTGRPTNVYDLDTDEMTQLGLAALRPGESWDIPGALGSIELVGYERWMSVRVAHDPGRPLLLLGAVIALVGLCLSLFVRRRRIWVRWDDGRLVIAGAGRGDGERIGMEVADLAHRLGRPTTDAGPARMPKPRTRSDAAEPR